MIDAHLNPPEPQWTEEEYNLVFARNMREARLQEEDEGEFAGDIDLVIDTIASLGREDLEHLTFAIRRGFNHPTLDTDGYARSIGKLILREVRDSVIRQLEPRVEIETAEELTDKYGRAEQ